MRADSHHLKKTVLLTWPKESMSPHATGMSRPIGNTLWLPVGVEPGRREDDRAQDDGEPCRRAQTGDNQPLLRMLELTEGVIEDVAGDAEHHETGAEASAEGVDVDEDRATTPPQPRGPGKYLKKRQELSIPNPPAPASGFGLY